MYDDGDYEKESLPIRLGLEYVKTQLELDSSFNERNNKMQTIIVNLEDQGSGLVNEKNMSMQKEIYKRNRLGRGSFKKLPINNHAFLIIEKTICFVQNGVC